MAGLDEDPFAENFSLNLDHLNLTSSSLETLGFNLCSDMRGAKGRVIFSLDDLEVGKLWYSEHGNTVMRINQDEILLGDSITFPVARPATYVLPLLPAKDGSVTAEMAVEHLIGAPLSIGLPVAFIEKSSQCVQQGRVIFSLRELPEMQDAQFTCAKGLNHKICRLRNDVVLIDGGEFMLAKGESSEAITPSSPSCSSSASSATTSPTPASPASVSTTPTATSPEQANDTNMSNSSDQVKVDEPPVSPHATKEEYRAHLEESISKKRAALREQRKKQMLDELQSKYG